ncbi:restriction endonuclease subunit S [Hymenobacter sediminis]|uniref:restriction endonuclease subunit S n=1 Tax=Hymenobacter sediminis TaxID=2218621 RepID=UPI000DA6487D|nr:restriction endonuclease subunit S [Hymenobacter sediminis]RPD43760.1 restriction endonuclease subunit S [Hymenobacter sediminis]
MYLTELAHISTGTYAPAQPVPDGTEPPPGAVTYLQLSEFDEDGQRLASEPGAYLQPDTPPAATSLLTASSLLLSARGGRLFAVLVEEAWLPAVAANNFFVLEVAAPDCLPAFLLMLLNLPDTKVRLRSRLGGTTQVNINKRDLLDFEPLPSGVSLPPLPQQQFLADLYQLWLREKNLTLRYLAERETYLTSRLTDLLKSPQHIPSQE